MQLFPTIQRILAIGVLVLSASAWAQAPSSTEIINTMCPVTTDEEIDPMFTAEYMGQTVGLCCRKCRTRFEENPEAYLAELPMLQAVSTAAPSGASSGNDSQPAAHDDSEPHEHAETTNEEHDDSEDHDHAVDHAKGKSGFAKLIAWLGKFHPPATHLPIGMLIGAALAEGLFILTKHELFRSAGTFCVALASLGALAAVTLGWFNGGFVLVDDQWVQTVHRWLGTSTTALTLVTAALLVRASKNPSQDSARFAYRVSLFAAATMVGATGFFGGALVYGLNHYAW